MTLIARFSAVAALLCTFVAPAQADTAAGSVIGGFAEIANSVSGACPASSLRRSSSSRRRISASA